MLSREYCIPIFQNLKTKLDGTHTTINEINEASVSDGSPPSARALFLMDLPPSARAMFQMDLPTISEAMYLDD